MFMKNDKKKKSPVFAMIIGVAAVYGAYSMVSDLKNICCQKCKMLTNMFKKKEKCTCDETPCCADDAC